MPVVNVYASDPGDDVLLGGGPAINVIEVATQSAKRARGRGVLGLVGAVVNDRGAPGVAVVLEDGIEDIFNKYGNFKAWLGDGLGAGEAGATSGYEGNLAAHCWKLSAPAVHLVPVDLAIKTATIATGTDLLVSFTRAAATYGEVTIPAGTRISDGAGYILATLEDVYYGAAVTGALTVRARQVSDSSVSPVALNTVTTIVDTIADSAITCNTAAVTVPDLIDAAEMELRYEAALDAINDNLPGQMINWLACDRQEATLLDAVSAHCATSTSEGFWRRAVVSPPVGTAAADARTGGADSADRAGLTQASVAYCHPAWTRSFPLDSDNLTAPLYTATFPSAITTAARIVQEKPEQNPGTGHQSLKTWGATGLEALSGGQPSKATHWGSNIMQPIFERGSDGTMSASYHDGIMANGTKIADRRMRDYLQEGLVIQVKPHHKKVATKANRDAAAKGAFGWLRYLQSPDDPSRARIGAFSVTSIWDAANNHLRLKCVIALLGNLDTITFHVDAQTSNADVVVEEVS